MVRWLGAFSLFLIWAAEGHLDVSGEIRKLTAEIKEKPTAELYLRRATEYRALRGYDHAIDDLRASLALKESGEGLRFLGSLLSKEKKHEEAVKVGKRLLEVEDSEVNQLAVANFYWVAGDEEKALVHVRKGPKDEDHRYLLEGYLLREKPKEAEAVLTAARKESKSVVIRNTWLDTAIDAGKFEEVMPIVEKEIRTSRYTASYRLRLVRAIGGGFDHGSPEKVKAESLEFALAELEKRIHPERPDLTLIYDRGMALALAGKKEEARKDLERLKKSTLSVLSYWRLERMLGK